MKKNWLVNFVNKREERFSGGEPRAAAFHSRNYHRHFEGYTEVRRVRPDGRVRIERVYTGVYYVPALDKKKRTGLCAAYALLWLLAAAAFVIGATRPAGCNAAWYVNVFQAASVAALFWMFMALVNYLTAPPKRTIHEQRVSSVSLKNAGMAAAVSLALAALAALVYLLVHLRDNPGAVLFCTALSLAAGGLCFCVNRMERTVPYLEEQSAAAPDTDGETIE